MVLVCYTLFLHVRHVRAITDIAKGLGMVTPHHLSPNFKRTRGSRLTIDSCPVPTTFGPLVQWQACFSTSRWNSGQNRCTMNLMRTQGLANAGSGLGGLLFSNTTRLAIENLSVKYALIINGCISAVVLLPAVWYLKERSAAASKAKNEPLKLSYLYHPGFFWVWTWGAFSSSS